MEKKEGKQSVRGRIISAAWELFRDKGFGRTTVDDIIERSGTSKGSFYYYFDTKDELLNTLAVVLDDYYEELESRMSQETDSFEKLLYLNREVHAMMEEKISIELNLERRLEALGLTEGSRITVLNNDKKGAMTGRESASGRQQEILQADLPDRRGGAEAGRDPGGPVHPGYREILQHVRAGAGV